MDKSAITMTADDDWWLERITMDGEHRYPERIRVGSLENPRVYVPERTCHNLGGEEGTNYENYDFGCSACGYGCDLPEPDYCPGCGARVVEEGE